MTSGRDLNRTRVGRNGSSGVSSQSAALQSEDGDDVSEKTLDRAMRVREHVRAIIETFGPNAKIGPG